MRFLTAGDLHTIEVLVREKRRDESDHDKLVHYSRLAGRVGVALDDARFIERAKDAITQLQATTSTGDYLELLDELQDLVQEQNARWGGKP